MILVVADTWEEMPNDLPWDHVDGVVLVSIGHKICTWKRALIRECASKFVKFHQVHIVPPIKKDQYLPEQLLVGCGLLFDKDVIVYGTGNREAPSGGSEKGTQ